MTFTPRGESKQMAEAVISHRPDLRLGIYVGKKSPDLFGRVDRHHTNRMITAINVMHFAGHTGTKITKQIKTGATDFVESDIRRRGEFNSFHFRM